MKQFTDDAVRKSEGDSAFTLTAFHPCPEELNTARASSLASIGYDVFFAAEEVPTLPKDPTPREVSQYVLYKESTPAQHVLKYEWVQEAGVSTVEELRKFLRDKDPQYEEQGRIKRDNLKKYGCADWYDWQIEHWGTKWDVSCEEADLRRGNPGIRNWRVSYEFDSAWSPPIPAIEHISATYTRLTFTLLYAEAGNAYEGRAVFENGLQIEDLEQEYSGDLLERDYF